MKHFCQLAVFALLFTPLILQAQTLTILQHDKPTSIRGLSVVNDKTAWISGSKGYVAITNNGGTTWTWLQIKGYEKSDFRDIEAFSNKEAIIMSSGTPALVIKTNDGGKSWQEKYRKTDTSYFFDAMDFVDHQHGYILGDPINNKFLLMETKNGGETWTEMKNAPDALPGEAAFAASGTCLRVNDKFIYIASGGRASRIIQFSASDETWDYNNLPIVHTKASQGAFSLSIGKNKVVVVGGDYENDQKVDSTAAVDVDHSFELPQKGPEGFQSCVTYIKDNIFLSTGTSGSNITTDGGKIWRKIDRTSFNVCGKAKHGKLILFTGNNGKISIFKM